MLSGRCPTRTTTQAAVNCLYREGYELVYKTASYRIGGKPRPERSWEVMSTEIAEAIKRA
mgnify:CR=1 FL=1